MRSLTLILVLTAGAVRAGTITGQIEDPSLRRKTTLVYVETAPGTFAPPGQPALMNQIRNTYSPRVLPVLVGQKVEFRSEDPELHNVYARQAKTTLFNQAVLPHKSFQKSFDKPGVVHREMSADVLVLQNPFYAQPDAAGRFTISGIPDGKYTLRIFGAELSDEQRARTFSVTASAGLVKLAMK
jgi:plastocyanin